MHLPKHLLRRDRPVPLPPATEQQLRQRARVGLATLVLQATARGYPRADRLLLTQRRQRLPGNKATARAERSLDRANRIGPDLNAGLPAQRAVGMPGRGADRCHRQLAGARTPLRLGRVIRRPAQMSRRSRRTADPRQSPLSARPLPASSPAYARGAPAAPAPAPASPGSSVVSTSPLASLSLRRGCPHPSAASGETGCG